MSKMEYIDKGNRLIEAVEKYIGFDSTTGLLRDKSSNSYELDTFENISLAIAYLLNNKRQEAEMIVSKVEKLIGFDKTGLIRNKLNSTKIFLSDNALLAFYYFLVSKKEEAKRLIEHIENFIGVDPETGLFRNGINRPEIYAFNSLLMAIIYLMANDIDKSNKLFNIIINYFVIDNESKLLLGLGSKKNKAHKNKEIFTLDNSLLAIYYTLSGKEKKAEEIIMRIEKYIGFDESTGLVKKSIKDTSGTVYSYVNNILVISYYILGERFKINFSKTENEED